MTKKVFSALPLILLTAISLPTFFYLLSETSISLHSDEIIYVRVIQELLHDGLSPYGNFLGLTHGHTPYFHKPPLGFWITAIPVWIFGESNLSYHLVNATLGLASVLLTFFISLKITRSQTAALLSGLILLSIKPFIVEEHGARKVVLDGFLVVFLALAMLIAWRLFSEWSKSEKQVERKSSYEKNSLALIGLLTGLSILTKSYAGLLPLIISGLLLLLANPIRCLKNWKLFFYSALIAFTIAVCYFLPHFLFSEGAFHKTVIREWTGRITLGTDRSDGAWLYFRRLFLYDLVNSSFICILATLFAIWQAIAKRDLPSRFLLVWALTPLALYSLIPSQLIWYLAPALPAWAMLSGNLLSALLVFLLSLPSRFSGASVRQKAYFSLSSIVCIIILGMSFLEGIDDSRTIAKAILAKPKLQLSMDKLASDVLRIKKQGAEVAILGTPLDTRANPRHGAFNVEAIYWRFFEPDAVKLDSLADATKIIQTADNAILISDLDSGLQTLTARTPDTYASIRPFRVRKKALLALGYGSLKDAKLLRPWKQIINFGSPDFEVLYGFGTAEVQGGSLEVRFLNSARAAFLVEGDRVRKNLGTKQTINIGHFGSSTLELDLMLNESLVSTLSLKPSSITSYAFDIPPETWEEGENVFRLIPRPKTKLIHRALMLNWLTISPQVVGQS